MGHIKGFFRIQSEAESVLFCDQKPKVATDRLSVFFEEAVPTICHGSLSGGGFIAVGVGLSTAGKGVRHLGRAGWADVISRRKIAAEVDGQFLVLRWDANGLYIQNDYIGLRTLYFCEAHGVVYFSTISSDLTALQNSPS